MWEVVILLSEATNESVAEVDSSHVEMLAEVSVQVQEILKVDIFALS